MTDKSFVWLGFVPIIVTTLLFIAQIVVGLLLLPGISQIEIVAYFGVALYVLSGLFFGLFPVMEFQKKGRVQKGKSYINTTQLVDTGIYSIVRHPQYVTFILWAVAGMLLFQHWIIILLGIPIIPLTYVDLLRADKDVIAKFGDDYTVYMMKVPRANFVLGVIRRLQDKS
jgi:protein-S-isoprenylcysteine O-methyltransferase Ste14